MLLLLLLPRMCLQEKQKVVHVLCSVSCMWETSMEGLAPGFCLAHSKALWKELA